MKHRPEQQKPAVKRRLPRSKGTLNDLSRILWFAVLEVRQVLEQESEPMLKLKAAHALATVAGTYTRILEASDLEARVAALEASK